ncbi:MAG TPA: alpha-D-ribose 1-methylphosphonate 5-phosphate C-P-lyase PhnJ [Vicinamibacterales bacterium]|nr:alpha-D-ribose 1-methylphosphonate 5-phosphate C-P-lyase PhnJ [Vicinamibacterales bacterium]
MVDNTKFKASYSYAFIDESTKKEVRRKMLKAVSIPGYQVPYSSPEMPISRGWGTGGLHLTLSLIGRTDVFKIIDQGSDASVNACSLREFVKAMTDCEVTFDTAAATLIQTRHRVPEEILTDKQILILQVPQPEILRGVERYESKTRQMHGEADYAKIWVSLYESYVRFGTMMRGAGYPIRVNGRYIATPSPIPRWDVPNLNMAHCLYLFGAGREKRIHCIPPYTRVEPLQFEDVLFKVEEFRDIVCAASGEDRAFMDEIYDAGGTRKFVVNDSNFLDKLKTGSRPPQRLFVNPD